MILRFFKTNQPSAAFAIPIVALVLWMPGMFRPSVIDSGDGMPVYHWLYSLVKPLPPLLIKLVCISVVSFEAIYIHRIVVRHDVLFNESYMPSLMFAVIASCTPEFQQFSPVLLVNLLMLFVINKSFALFKEAAPISLIFDSSFLVAVASLIYLPAVFFFVLLLVGLLVLRPFNWHEWIIALIGFVLPYFFISVYFFWVDNLKQFYTWLFSNHINKRLFFEIHFTKPLTILIGLFGVLLALSFFKLRDNFYKNAIKTRIAQQIIIVYFIIALLSAVMQSTITFEQFELLAFPMAVFIGYFFLSVKKRFWMSEVLFFLMMTVIVANLFYT